MSKNKTILIIGAKSDIALQLQKNLHQKDTIFSWQQGILQN